MNKLVTAAYQTKCGAHCTQTFRVTDQVTFGRWIERQRRPVEVFYEGEEIGGVIRRDGHWYWWYDPDPFVQAHTQEAAS